jgi:hypothetical protein
MVETIQSAGRSRFSSGGTLRLTQYLCLSPRNQMAWKKVWGRRGRLVKHSLATSTVETRRPVSKGNCSRVAEQLKTSRLSINNPQSRAQLPLRHINNHVDLCYDEGDHPGNDHILFFKRPCPVPRSLSGHGSAERYPLKLATF